MLNANNFFYRPYCLPVKELGKSCNTTIIPAQFKNYSFVILFTRSKNGGLCRGVDANRNYGYHFDDGGSSDSTCSETYHGPSAFSEVENQVEQYTSRSEVLSLF
jgi:Zinc carboxypeptidase